MIKLMGYYIFLAVILFAPWVVNAVKLVDCDFESPYKCEAIHAIGVFIPPASYVTVWFGTDS